MATKLIRYSKWSRSRVRASRALCKILKHTREARGLKATYIAAKMEISKSHLSDLESGRRLWNEDLIRRFCCVVCPESIEQYLNQNKNNNHAKSTN